ncbi:CAMK protein kinase [Magnaporthiopsis poae ATCC 64411]|uniref:CAMK protein kinase n=1 Tax=Magnaporthiopsis poae (strain ATCC 64411 / 73-15) TaxID=644358 RepID=A0A0C4DQU4_MAGP6|nr:CAMK protein kinase [Magnaporthiopsis poae ATCC 64411]
MAVLSRETEVLLAEGCPASKRKLHVPILRRREEQPLHIVSAAMSEHATQSTNPNSSDNPRYQAVSAAATAPRPEVVQEPIAATDKGNDRAEPPAAQQPRGTEDVISKLFPENLAWLRLSEDDKRTRLLFLPTDPDTFHLEHIGLHWATDVEGYPDSCSRWLELACGDKEGSFETPMVMAVAQSIYHTACKVSLRSEDSTRVDFEIFYDPETDQVVLKTGESSPTLVLHQESESSSHGHQIVYSGVNTHLDPGAWQVAAPRVGRTTTLLVLQRRFLPAEGSAEKPEPASGKRSTSDALVGKRIKGKEPAEASGATLVQRHAVSEQPEHPLVRLKEGQTLELAGSLPLEQYSVQRTRKLAENNSSSVWRVIVSWPESPSSAMVAKTVLKGTGDVMAAAQGWEREARIHSKLNTSGIVDEKEKDMTLKRLRWPILPGGRGPANLFTGPRGVADRVMQDMALALDHVHRAGVAHNDIKPGNILYSDTRGAVLIDFGLSSDSAETADHVHAAGTPWYIPPEFLAEPEPRGFPGDVWALGVVQPFLLKLLPLPETTVGWRISAVVGPKGPGRDEARGAMTRWLGQVDHARELFARERPHADMDTIVCQMTKSDCHERITMSEITRALKEIESKKANRKEEVS